jgi:3-hydroxypropanoate dehydrogenase
MTQISDEALKQIFLDARTHSAWLDKPVDDALLVKLYETARLGPTSANGNPMRVVFVKSPEGKARLLPTLMPGNVEKTRTAPVTAIVAHDVRFFDKLDKLFPAYDMKSAVAGMPAAIQQHMALLNGSLGGAYLIVAARALGLDVGAMAGFDNAKVDAAFFPEGQWKSNFLVNLGYGDASKLFPRAPRLSFEEACKIV